jgi:hypothetical protein
MFAFNFNLRRYDKEFDGDFHLDDGIKVGYLRQGLTLADTHFIRYSFARIPLTFVTRSP